MRTATSSSLITVLDYRVPQEYFKSLTFLFDWTWTPLFPGTVTSISAA